MGMQEGEAVKSDDLLRIGLGRLVGRNPNDDEKILEELGLRVSLRLL